MEANNDVDDIAASLAQMRLEIGNAAYEVASLGSHASLSTNKTDISTFDSTSFGRRTHSTAPIIVSDIGAMFQNAVFDDSDSRAVKDLDVGEPIFFQNRTLPKAVAAAPKSKKRHSPTPIEKMNTKFLPRSASKMSKSTKSHDSNNCLNFNKTMNTYKLPASFMKRPSAISRSSSPSKSINADLTLSVNSVTEHIVNASPVLTPSRLHSDCSQHRLLPFYRYQLLDILALRPNLKSLFYVGAPNIENNRSPEDFRVRYTFHELLAGVVINDFVPRPSCAELARQLQARTIGASNLNKVPIENLPPLRKSHEDVKIASYPSLSTACLHGSLPTPWDKTVPTYLSLVEGLGRYLENWKVSDDPQYNIVSHFMAFSERVSIVIGGERSTYYAILEWVERQNGAIGLNLFMRHLSRIIYVNASNIRRYREVLEDTGLRLWFQHETHIDKKSTLFTLTMYFESNATRIAFIHALTHLQDMEKKLKKDWLAQVKLTPTESIIGLESLYSGISWEPVALARSETDSYIELGKTGSPENGLDSLPSLGSPTGSVSRSTPPIAETFPSISSGCSMNLMDFEVEQDELSRLNKLWEAIVAPSNAAICTPIFGGSEKSGSQEVDIPLIEFEKPTPNVHEPQMVLVMNLTT
ncbi:hypothetical protein BROUX41_001746 [Berkeleyomyces rouxiae]